MGTVIPSEFPRDHSDSEHLIYRKLRDETPDDWTALHSVGLANHDRKLWAEIDFVAITDHAVLCLEVKGGQLRVDKGKWFAGDRRLTHTPFEQAGGAASALRNYLRRALGDRTPVVGWGVLFPSSEFAVLTPEADRALVYDDEDRAHAIHVYLDALTAYWGRQHSETSQRIDEALHGELVELLAPDFDLLSTLRSRVRGVTDELVRMTAQQSEVFRGFETQPRLMVRGGAGTGKTLLAMAEAERLAANEDAVLLTCASGSLATDFARAFAGQQRVRAIDAYALAAEILATGQAADRIPTAGQEDVLGRFLPEVAAEVMPAAQRGSCRALVVDEAQDLVSPYWLAFFDALLDGGLENGTWRFFLDPNQDLLLGSAPVAIDRLDQAAHSRYQLTKNCRNSREIGIATAMLTGLETFDTLKVTGPKVIEHRYESDVHQRDLASSVLREWIEGGLSPQQITVLASVPLRHTVLAGLGEAELGAPLREGAAAGDHAEQDAINFAAIGDFKGFESDAVLVVGVDDLQPGLKRLELYVAMSRARAVLAVLISSSVAEQYDALVADFADRMKRGFVALS